ncbi:MAG: hypothetical protein H7Y38_05055 [Armatimonadetes bacterium]|nr:hypothetical protein [Armatimonadota bacterium]
MLSKRFALPLLAAATTLFAAPAFAQDTPADKLPLRILPAPPMSASYAKSAATPAKTRLRLVSKTANDITDDDKWFARTGLRLPDYAFMGANQPYADDQLPDGSPMTYAGIGLRRALPGASKDRVLLLYGNNFASENLLVKTKTPGGEPVYALDFTTYRSPLIGDADPVTQAIGFALEDAAGTLFVSHAANGYAKESGGKTGYITALEPKSGKMLWRSAPLTSNANTFAQTGDALICGYGFTAEPDFLYVLDKRTGKRVQTIPLKSGPSYILRRGNRVYVRCYDTDYVFAVK